MFFVVLGFVVQVADSSFKLDPQISLLPQLQNNHLPLFYELAHLAMLMLWPMKVSFWIFSRHPLRLDLMAAFHVAFVQSCCEKVTWALFRASTSMPTLATEKRRLSWQTLKYS
jgi:hypothetical protein